MNEIIFTPIGIIHTPFTDQENMPIQPAGGEGIEGTIEIDLKYQTGLQDLGGFSHIILLYHLHLSRGYSLTVTPFLDTEPRGLFATRAPTRPNSIGLSVVRLLDIEKNILTISDVDISDGTPLLDIKPYVPAMQPTGNVKTGWLDSINTEQISRKRSDDRF